MPKKSARFSLIKQQNNHLRGRSGDPFCCDFQSFSVIANQCVHWCGNPFLIDGIQLYKEEFGSSYTYSNDLLTSIQTPSTTYGFTFGDFDLRTSVSAGSYTLAEYTYTNDKNRYLSALDYGNGDSVQYTYDDHGRLVTQTYEDGDSLYHKYDNSGNLASVRDSATARTTYYYYDLTDRMMRYVEKGDDGYSHSVGYEYDKLNNLTQQVETINGVDHTTSYSYDDDNRVTSATTDGVSVNYSYDDLGRLQRQSVWKNDEVLVLEKSFTYTAPTSGSTSAQIASCTITSGVNNYSFTYTYTYDDNGNITSISDGAVTYTYGYDSANQLIQANHPYAMILTTWTYDAAGNILSEAEQDYSAGELGEAYTVGSYTYDENRTGWGDLLTSYNGQYIESDRLGNIVNDADWTYTWEHGRQLKSMFDGTTTWTYTYDANGMRTGRSNGTDTYTYVYNGSQLVQLTKGTDTLYFTYDATGTPVSLNYNGTAYYYITNIQGDVTAIWKEDGSLVVDYMYDPWGRHINSSTVGTIGTTLYQLNPLRYRGYVYDVETGLYYLQSRYYNPELGRFISADAFTSTGQGFVGNNMFAYCLNNPVNFVDKDGKRTAALQWWSGSMWWLCGADTALPIGDIIYGIGIIVFGIITLATNQVSTPQATFDEATITYGSPAPNNNDDDDDDYYDDDSNFGGRQKVGKSKGNTPGNNQKQNKQFKDATKGLTKGQQRMLHDQISGQGLGYQDIAKTAKELFSFIFLPFTFDD